MKTRTVVWALIVSFSLASVSRAGDPSNHYEAVAADVVLARPLWLVATAVGTGLFIVTLPVAAMSGSVNKTGRALVARPAQATFTRPLGDFSTID